MMCTGLWVMVAGMGLVAAYLWRRSELKRAIEVLEQRNHEMKRALIAATKAHE